MFSAINFIEDGALAVAGAIGGYWLFPWKGGSLKKAVEFQQQSLIEAAKREAEAIAREARLKANEDALKVREEAEQSFSARRKEQADMEGRLTQRESLVNRQLENIVADEKNLRAQREGCAAQASELERRLIEAEHLKQERI